MDKYTQIEDMYLVNNPSANYYRHFGLKKDGKLYLTKNEMLYLADPDPKEEYDLNTKAYFYIKNSFYNVLTTESGELLIYKKTSHFNRKKDLPISSLKFVNKENTVNFNEDTIFCILSEKIFTFLKAEKIESLSLETTSNLFKNQDK